MTTTAAPSSASGGATDAAIRQGSKSFALASRLFDPGTRALVWDLYTWCRHCDDAVDGQILGHDARKVDATTRLADIVAGTERALADDGPVPDGAFAALRRVARATGLPPALPRAHLDGFAMDAAGRTYATLDDTLEYCFHVAGVVGLMMAWVMGARDRAALERGCDLGLAFQLTNICRDVGDDAALGRVYLPADRLAAAGAVVTGGQRLDPAQAAHVAAVVDGLLRDADRYYDSAWHGLSALPWRSAWAVATARHVYRAIGLEVRRRGGRAWDARVSTTTSRKLAGLAAGVADVVATRGRRPRGAGADRRGLWTPPLARMVG
jgi:phytoene synthase